MPTTQGRTARWMEELRKKVISQLVSSEHSWHKELSRGACCTPVQSQPGACARVVDSPPRARCVRRYAELCCDRLSGRCGGTNANVNRSSPGERARDTTGSGWDLGNLLRESTPEGLARWMGLEKRVEQKRRPRRPGAIRPWLRCAANSQLHTGSPRCSLGSRRTVVDADAVEMPCTQYSDLLGQK